MSTLLPNAKRHSLPIPSLQIEVKKKKNDPARQRAAKRDSTAQNRHVRFENVMQVVNHRKRHNDPAKTEDMIVMYFPIFHHVSTISFG
mmetsp:Transcript_7095/g.10352  ORF Transcript_7095/g.10352 Transcript_7095/m.10352 type:complete len:88 (-) Transcript_7095:364-627(-)